jgi:hypothetical protein
MIWKQLLLLFLLLPYYSDSFTVSGYSMSIKQCKVKLLRTRGRIFNNLYNYSPLRFHELLSFSTQRTYAWPLMNGSWPPSNRYVQVNYIPEKGKGFCVVSVDHKVVKIYCKTTKQQNNGILWKLMWDANLTLLLLCQPCWHISIPCEPDSTFT